MTRTDSASSTAVALANPWAVVPPLGNLDAYITAVNRLPMLTQEEEQRFARQLRWRVTSVTTSLTMSFTYTCGMLPPPPTTESQDVNATVKRFAAGESSQLVQVAGVPALVALTSTVSPGL